MKTGLADRVLQGDGLAAARLITAIEDEVPGALEELKLLRSHTGRAHVVGITGAAGVGKSTLIGRLIGDFRRRDVTIGIIASDPSSPFTHGAILGDRIRMRYNVDEGVFIRSLAVRGQGGGLSKATPGVIQVMDAMGRHVILVETVGTGQTETDIAVVADTCIVIMVPGMGDEIQLIKAGILEVADIFVINKAARDGTEDLKRGLEVMLALRSHRSSGWTPAIILTEAASSDGISELTEVILRHREFLTSSSQPSGRQAG